jgi:aminoglycoside phosphotransferase family enzyme
LKTNWNENFIQSNKFIGRTISKSNFDLVQQKIIQFMERNKKLLDSRRSNGRIRDCHGDIHSGNIFVTDRVYIFDAIEFSKRFRYSDMASDMAFLAMDLEFKKRASLSDFFVKKYMQYTHDEQLLDLLTFYKCYRAFVRGKVTSFKLDDPNICDKEKGEAKEEATAYLLLASSYAQNI